MTRNNTSHIVDIIIIPLCVLNLYLSRCETYFIKTLTLWRVKDVIINYVGSALVLKNRQRRAESNSQNHEKKKKKRLKFYDFDYYFYYLSLFLRLILLLFRVVQLTLADCDRYEFEKSGVEKLCLTRKYVRFRGANLNLFVVVLNL